MHKKTGKPLGGFHRTRVWGAKQDVLNEEVRLIEGESEDEFWKWVDRWFGLDPDDQYHGEF